MKITQEQLKESTTALNKLVAEAQERVAFKEALVQEPKKTLAKPILKNGILVIF